MSTIHIPDTVDGVNSLLTVRRWEKAAIVWAYVHSSENQAHANSSMMGKPYSPESFANLGIAGLRSKDTVRAYWQRWQDAIDNGHANPVHPGDTVEIPTVAWVSTDTDSRAGGAGRHVSKQQIANAIKDDPTIVEEVYAEDRGVREATRRASQKRQADIRAKAKADGGITCDGDHWGANEQTEAEKLSDLLYGMDGVVAEADRRDGIDHLLRYSEVIGDAAKEWADKWGCTGVEDEVAAIQQTMSNLRAAQARISTFIITTGKDATK